MLLHSYPRIVAGLTKDQETIFLPYFVKCTCKRLIISNESNERAPNEILNIYYAYLFKLGSLDRSKIREQI